MSEMTRDISRELSKGVRDAMIYEFGPFIAGRCEGASGSMAYLLSVKFFCYSITLTIGSHIK
jgi:hypothetical protein